jgi:hypothetical protein
MYVGNHTLHIPTHFKKRCNCIFVNWQTKNTRVKNRNAENCSFVVHYPGRVLIKRVFVT